MFAESSSTQHNRDTNKRLVKIIHALLESDQSVAFRKPVPHKALGLGDYKKIVKRPIDLNQIRRQNNESKYKNIEDALDDIQLCWDNCKLYNHVKSELYQQAIALQKQFWNLVQQNFPDIFEKTKDKMKEEAIAPQKSPSEGVSQQEEHSLQPNQPEVRAEDKNESKMDIEGEEAQNSQMEEQVNESAIIDAQDDKSQRSKSEMIKQAEKEPIMVSLREGPTLEQVQELSEHMRRVEDKPTLESILEILFSHERENMISNVKGEMSFRMQKIHLSTYHRICKILRIESEENLEIIE